MINSTILIGRLAKDPKVKELESGKKVSNITLAVNKPYRDVNGKYGVDFIDCTLWQEVAENTSEYCEKGDLIGVKGRLEIRDKKLILVAENITFLNHTKQKEDEELDDLPF